MKRMRAVISTGFVVVAFACNTWVLAWMLHRKFPFSWQANTTIASGQIALLLIAFLIARPSALRVVIAWLRASQTLRWQFSPLRDSWFWISLLPMLGASFYRQFIGWEGSEFTWWHPAACLAIVEGALISALFWSGAMALCASSSRRIFAAVIVIVGFAVIWTIDSEFIRHGRMRLRWEMVESTNSAFVLYIDRVAVATLCLFGIAGALGYAATNAYESMRYTRSASQRFGLAVLLLALRPAPVAEVIVTSPIPPTSRGRIETHLHEATRFSSEPIFELAFSTFAAPRGRIIGKFSSEDRAALAAYRFVETSIARIRPRRRLVLITLESMSMTLCSRYNPNLRGCLTPNIDELPESAHAVFSVATPTEYGLAAHLCSHPNGAAMVNTGHPDSLAGILSHAGFQTCYMQAATLGFQSGARRFRELGYRELYGRDEFSRMPRYTSFISQWGLCDRMLYEAAFSWLQAHRNDRVFLHMLTADTHGPHGRLDYHSLVYPDTPVWVREMGISKWYLEAWFRADHDLGVFLRNLRSSGLLDGDTAVVVTGDHSSLGSAAYRAVPGTAANRVERIPWILITRDELPIDRERLSSQVDTAPTIAEIAGISAPRSWWGSSLFARVRGRLQLAWRNGKALGIDSSGRELPIAPTIERLGWDIDRPPHVGK